MDSLLNKDILAAFVQTTRQVKLTLSLGCCNSLCLCFSKSCPRLPTCWRSWQCHRIVSYTHSLVTVCAISLPAAGRAADASSTTSTICSLSCLLQCTCSCGQETSNCMGLQQAQQLCKSQQILDNVQAAPSQAGRRLAGSGLNTAKNLLTFSRLLCLLQSHTV